MTIDEVRAHVAGVKRRLRQLQGRCTLRALNEIKFGGPVTGAPGQPVQEGALRESFHASFPSDGVSTITSDSPYARPIERGIGKHGPLTLRSPVGGFGSIETVRANFDRIVAHENAAMRSGEGTAGGAGAAVA